MIKNLTSLYSLHFFKYLIPLILIPYLARTLGLEAWGKLAIAQAFATYLSLFIEYGFDLSATKNLTQCRSNGNDRATILADVLGAKIILTILSVLISLLFLVIFPLFIDNEILFYSAIFFSISSSFNLLWYFQGIEKLVIASLVDIIIRSLGIVFVFTLVKDSNDAPLVLSIYGISSFIITIILYFIINKDTKIQLPSFSGSLSILKTGWNMFVYKFSVSFYTTGNALLLALFVTPEVVALYTGAEKISKALLGLLAPITQVLYPRISFLTQSSYADAEILFKKSLVIISAISILMSIGIYLSANLLISVLLGTEFIEAVDILEVLALLPILIAISNVLGVQWMLPNGMEKAFNRIIIASGVINLLLVFTLAPYFQAKGMAWAVVISELIVTLSMTIYLWNRKKLSFNNTIKEPFV